MKKLLKPSILKGTLSAPASKSMMQRAIAASILSEGKSTLTNASFCNDSLSALAVAEKVGAQISIDKLNQKVEIVGGFSSLNQTFNCGESGLWIRMFSPIAALFDKELILTGEGSLKKRSVEMVENALKQFGVECHTTSNFLPIKIKGPLQSKNALIDGSISSQLLSGLLFALPKCTGDSTLTVSNLKSKPYIDMTIDLLKIFGVSIENNNYESFYIKGNQTYEPQNYVVEGDWSNMAFWLVAGAINGDITLNCVNFNSKQADKAILKALSTAGANYKIKNDSISISKSSLKGFSFDATDCPDLFPPLVALAINCESETSIKGVSRLYNKESNRAESLKSEFEKIGAIITILDDEMKIRPHELHGATTKSHNDHRIAMALSIAALNCEDEIYLDEAESVSKSYPEFYADYELLGGNITTV